MTSRPVAPSPPKELLCHNLRAKDVEGGLQQSLMIRSSFSFSPSQWFWPRPG
ncbi:MAG: hypothetical protein MI923_19295 [Phycisphaerales bacterium]|nr:hypothetical protein [Phycisphaerales bacterium]